MATDRSCVKIVTDAQKTNSNKLVAAVYGDTSGGENISQPLSATGTLPATHWCGAAYQTGEIAAVLLAVRTGQLPAYNWASWGLTETSAQAAAAAMTIGVATGIASLPHLNGMLAGLNLMRVVED